MQQLRGECRAVYRRDPLLLAGLVLYCVFLAGFFFLDTRPHRNMFYVSLLPSAYILFAYKAQLAAFLQKNRFYILPAALYFLYMGVSLAWSDMPEAGRFFDQAKVLIFLPATLLALYALLREIPSAYSIMAYTVVGAAITAGVYLLATHILAGELRFRLEGLGRTDNPVMAGYMYSLMILAVLFAKPIQIFPRHWRMLAAALFLFVMLCTMSRGPLLSLGAALIGILFVQKNYKACLLLVLGIGFFAAGVSMTGARNNIPIINRGDTGRPQVWTQTGALIADAPLIGYGVGSKFYFPLTNPDGSVREHASHPHSVYLSTMLQGGAVGLIILLALLSAAVRGAWQAARQTGDYWPLSALISLCVFGLYDFGGLYGNIGIVWFAFWFHYVFALYLKNEAVAAQAA